MKAANHVMILTGAVLFASSIAAPVAHAQDSEAIVQKLLPDLGPKRSIRRGIVVEGAAKPVSQPQINLQISFEYRSADITPTGQASLDTLANAMKDQRLAEAKFQIVGHTDARGADDYNLDLSKRRALAVRDYLANQKGVPLQKLDAEGRGRRELADPARPEHEVNRRVQVISLWPNPASQ